MFELMCQLHAVSKEAEIKKITEKIVMRDLTYVFDVLFR